MLRIYHNPGCSKSRAALARLQAAGHKPEIVNYLDAPPSGQQLQALIRKLDVPGAELLRERPEAIVDDAAVIAALLAAPENMQRPIIEDERRAIIARPPQRADSFVQNKNTPA